MVEQSLRFLVQLQLKTVMKGVNREKGRQSSFLFVCQCLIVFFSKIAQITTKPEEPLLTGLKDP